MRVCTPITLLRSLSVKYPWERYEPPYPPSYGFNSTTTVLLGEYFDMPLKQRNQTNQNSWQDSLGVPNIFFLMWFVSIGVVHSYSSTDTDTAWEKSCFILSNEYNFHMIDNQSITVHAFPMRMILLISAVVFELVY